MQRADSRSVEVLRTFSRRRLTHGSRFPVRTKSVVDGHPAFDRWRFVKHFADMQMQLLTTRQQDQSFKKGPHLRGENGLIREGRQGTCLFPLFDDEPFLTSLDSFIDGHWSARKSYPWLSNSLMANSITTPTEILFDGPLNKSWEKTLEYLL